MLAKRWALYNGTMRDFLFSVCVSSLGFRHSCSSCCFLLLSGRKSREGCGALGLKTCPISHEPCSCPFWVKESPRVSIYWSTFSWTFAITSAAQRNFPPCLKCVGPTSQPRRYAGAPLWCLFPESHLQWETDGRRDSQGSEPVSKLDNAVIGWECSTKDGPVWESWA